MELAKRLVSEEIAVLTSDKRCVGEFGDVYVGPSVGTNNIEVANLALLARDAIAAANTFRARFNRKIPMPGFSQAGWIMPIAANRNQQV